MNEWTTPIAKIAHAARVASRKVATAGAEKKQSALIAIAEALATDEKSILAANARDLDAARAAGTKGALLDRLLLDPARVAKMAAAVREVAALTDPVGEVVKRWRRPNGLDVARVRIPLGVI